MSHAGARWAASRWSYLSLDVVLGAWANGMAAARLLGVEPPALWHLVLPAATWAVYTADHLLDAARMRERARTGRHQFHWRHRQPLAAACACALGLGGLGLWLPPPMAWAGLGVCGMVGLHLALAQHTRGRISPMLAKEAGVVAGYAGGIWLPLLALAWSQGRPWMLGAGAAGLLGGIAWLNLLVFALFDAEADRATHQPSWALALGRARTQQVIWGLGLALLAALAWAPLPPCLRAAFALMAIAQLGLVADMHRWAPGERFRYLGDGVFAAALWCALCG